MSFKVPDNFVFRGSYPMIGRSATFLKPLQPTQCWPDALLICLSKLGTDGDGGGRQKKLPSLPSTVSVTALKGCTLYEQVICYD